MKKLASIADDFIYISFCILSLGTWWAFRVLITKSIQIAQERRDD